MYIAEYLVVTHCIKVWIKFFRDQIELLFQFETENHFVLLALIHLHLLYYFLSFAVTHFHLLSLVVTRFLFLILIDLVVHNFRKVKNVPRLLLNCGFSSFAISIQALKLWKIFAKVNFFPILFKKILTFVSLVF